MNARRLLKDNYIAGSPVVVEEDEIHSSKLFNRAVDAVLELDGRGHRLDISVIDTPYDALIKISAELRQYGMTHSMAEEFIEAIEAQAVREGVDFAQAAKPTPMEISIYVMNRKPELSEQKDHKIICYDGITKFGGDYDTSAVMQLHIDGTRTTQSNVPKFEEMFSTGGKKYLTVHLQKLKEGGGEELDQKGADMATYVQAVGPVAAGSASGGSMKREIEAGTVSPAVMDLVQTVADIKQVAEANRFDPSPEKAAPKIMQLSNKIAVQTHQVASAQSLPPVLVKAVNQAMDIASAVPTKSIVAKPAVVQAANSNPGVTQAVLAKAPASVTPPSMQAANVSNVNTSPAVVVKPNASTAAPVVAAPSAPASVAPSIPAAAIVTPSVPAETPVAVAPVPAATPVVAAPSAPASVVPSIPAAAVVTPSAPAATPVAVAPVPASAPVVAAPSAPASVAPSIPASAVVIPSVPAATPVAVAPVPAAAPVVAVPSAPASVAPSVPAAAVVIPSAPVETLVAVAPVPASAPVVAAPSAPASVAPPVPAAAVVTPSASVAAPVNFTPAPMPAIAAPASIVVAAPVLQQSAPVSNTQQKAQPAIVQEVITTHAAVPSVVSEKVTPAAVEILPAREVEDFQPATNDKRYAAPAVQLSSLPLQTESIVAKAVPENLVETKPVLVPAPAAAPLPTILPSTAFVVAPVVDGGATKSAQISGFAAPAAKPDAAQSSAAEKPVVVQVMMPRLASVPVMPPIMMPAAPVARTAANIPAQLVAAPRIYAPQTVRQAVVMTPVQVVLPQKKAPVALAVQNVINNQIGQTNQKVKTAEQLAAERARDRDIAEKEKDELEKKYAKKKDEDRRQTYEVTQFGIQLVEWKAPERAANTTETPKNDLWDFKKEKQVGWGETSKFGSAFKTACDGCATKNCGECGTGVSKTFIGAKYNVS